MNAFQIIATGFGRICLSLVFILSAISQIFDWQESKLTLYNGLCDLMMFTPTNEMMQTLLGLAIPSVTIVLIVGVAIQLIGGLFVFFGLNVRLGAVLLMIFLICSTILFSHFWYLEGTVREAQLMMCLKNLSIFGGLLLVLAFGNGKASKNKSSDKKAEKKA
jgi:putative oxidoreductase